MRLRPMLIRMAFAGFLLSVLRLPPRSALFPYTTLFRSLAAGTLSVAVVGALGLYATKRPGDEDAGGSGRSEEHTSELQSRENLVCRLLLEKKKTPALSMTRNRTSSVMTRPPWLTAQAGC